VLKVPDRIALIFVQVNARDADDIASAIDAAVACCEPPPCRSFACSFLERRQLLRLLRGFTSQEIDELLLAHAVRLQL
jgi:hypothetical protein